VKNKGANKLLTGNPKEKGLSGLLKVRVRIILKLILRK
jgi:hypothetical protein